MSPSRLLLFGVLAAFLVLIGIVFVFDLWPWGGAQVNLSGTMFVSDAGQSHGGFEYTASYYVNLTITGKKGVLNLTLEIGLGDALEKHEYEVTDFSLSKDRLIMRIEGADLTLVWVENDTVWDHEYDNYYIASWGSESPQNEIRGNISPNIFPGLAQHYYVELRLKPT